MTHANLLWQDHLNSRGLEPKRLAVQFVLTENRRMLKNPVHIETPKEVFKEAVQWLVLRNKSL